MATPGNRAALPEADLARRIMASPGSAAEEEAELCERFTRRVWLFGLHHLRSEHQAADLVQRVMLVTLGKLRGGEVREPDRIGAFVLGVARTLLHENRRESRREQPLPDAETDLPKFVPEPEDPWTRERLRDCLGQLPERERSVVALTYFGEQRSAGIAASLGIQEGHVRIIRHRAIARLRDCLGLGEHL